MLIINAVTMLIIDSQEIYNVYSIPLDTVILQVM